MNRYYDPTTAVFLTVDPIVGRSNEPYDYAAGDPIANRDPDGRLECAEECGGDAPGARINSRGDEENGPAGRQEPNTRSWRVKAINWDPNVKTKIGHDGPKYIHPPQDDAAARRVLRNPDGINKFVPRNGYTQYYYEDHYQGFDGNFEVGGFWRARTFLVTHWDFVRFT